MWQMLVCILLLIIVPFISRRSSRIAAMTALNLRLGTPRRSRDRREKLALNSDAFPTIMKHQLEPMNQFCRQCGALKFRNESDGFCCVDGRVSLAPYPETPGKYGKIILLDILDDLLNIRLFVEKIIAYNQALSFTSLGRTKVVSDNDRSGVPYFKIQGISIGLSIGEMYHLIGQLLPERDGEIPTYNQIYFYDTDYESELNNRLGHFNTLNRVYLDRLQFMLHEINPFVHLL